jgi:rhodanese-related sulfurtransferase
VRFADKGAGLQSDTADFCSFRGRGLPMAWRSRFWWLPFGSVPEISPNELHAKLSGDSVPYILDVRTHREWKASRIEGAVNVPITSLRADLKNLGLESARPVIAICLSAHRSIPAVRALREAGFVDACQLQGGMLAWWKAGLPVVEGP